MNGGLIHNKKFNLVAFLSMGLFLLIGFIDIFSWIFIMLPVVVCFYVYDIRHGAVYLTSGEISISRKTKCSTFAKHFVPKSHLLTQFKM